MINGTLKKKTKHEQERMRIVEMAANIVLQDVRASHYDISSFPILLVYCKMPHLTYPPHYYLS